MRRFIEGGTFRISDRGSLGLATSWGSPPELALRDQVTTELVYRLQVTQNLSLTPNLQVCFQPSYNPAEDWISVVGLRMRSVF